MVRKKSPKSYVKSVEEFLAVSDWLSPSDAPAVAALENLAQALDDGGGAALVAQFGLTYRNLLKRSPSASADPEGDELEGILAEAHGS